VFLQIEAKQHRPILAPSSVVHSALLRTAGIMRSPNIDCDVFVTPAFILDTVSLGQDKFLELGYRRPNFGILDDLCARPTDGIHPIIQSLEIPVDYLFVLVDAIVQTFLIAAWG